MDQPKIVVKEVPSPGNKSMQEVEKKLLEEHEQKNNGDEGAPPPPPPPPAPEEVKTIEIKDEDVLSFVEKRFGKKISSVEDIFKPQKEELPDDVSAFLKYKKETGRGIKDFIELNHDYESMEEDQLLSKYYQETKKGLDKSDISALINDFNVDPEEDEKLASKAKIQKKQEVAAAREFFNNLKKKYEVPLESRVDPISEDDKRAIEEYKKLSLSAKAEEEELEVKRGLFTRKTDEIFSQDFKGFEFDVNGNKLTFNPADAETLKKSQSSPFNFLQKFVDEKGFIKDAAGYHKALAVAMNPEKFAKFFYEQGAAEALESSMKKQKNTNMSERRAPEAISKGVVVRAVNPDSGRGLKIKSSKK